MIPEFVRFDSLEEYLEMKEKAAKWDRVINTLEVCQDCPLRYRCVDGCVVEELVDALDDDTCEYHETLESL